MKPRRAVGFHCVRRGQHARLRLGCVRGHGANTTVRGSQHPGRVAMASAHSSSEPGARDRAARHHRRRDPAQRGGLASAVRRGALMAAIWLTARAEWRQRWRSVIVLSVLAGLAGSVVLAAFTGSRRADTAFVRLLEYQKPPTVFVETETRPIRSASARWRDHRASSGPPMMCSSQLHLPAPGCCPDTTRSRSPSQSWRALIPLPFRSSRADRMTSAGRMSSSSTRRCGTRSTSRSAIASCSSRSHPSSPRPATPRAGVCRRAVPPRK